MDDEAYLALEAISRSASDDLTAHGHWIKAFKAIRWVVQTEAGLTLTPAGRHARQEMADLRRENKSHRDGASPSKPAE